MIGKVQIKFILIFTYIYFVVLDQNFANLK